MSLVRSSVSADRSLRAVKTDPEEAMSESYEVLPEWDDRLPWAHQVNSTMATEVLRGSVETDLAVVLATAEHRPNKTDLTAIWRRRAGGTVTPVLVHVTYNDAGAPRVALLGPDADSDPAFDIEPDLAERLLNEALRSTSPSGLNAQLRERLQGLRSESPSCLRNEGLFASWVLQSQPNEPGWAPLARSGNALSGKRGHELLTALGYEIEPVPEGSVLRTRGENERRAAVVLLADDESLDNPLARFHNTSAVTHGLSIARRENLDWFILLGGSRIRLYATEERGVGHKGQTQTYLELDLAFLTGDEAGFLPLIFVSDALADGGSVDHLLTDSTRFATGLSERLRDRVYERVIPTLAVAVAARLNVTSKSGEERRAALDEAYHQAMIILFRLLFVAYAEDRQLLPFDLNDRYTRNALKTLARDLLDTTATPDANSQTIWDDLTQVWRVIDTGDIGGWGVPAYNGGLFTRDPNKNSSGAATYNLNLTNDQLAPALRGLLIDETNDGTIGPVDFRSLSVREFGTIYEGLLESGLDVAEEDLALDGDDYVLAQADDAIAVRRGDVYFHSRSGSRKTTGSYFTKPFAVNHLLNHALEPALADHLDTVKRLLDRGATKSAAEHLWEFRAADLSMGSGHFLVAAVDRIEAAFSAFLAENPLPEVAVELDRLRTTAAQQLSVDPEESGIDDGALLRRQIARRCIYGIDLNEIAVELARLALWIHTFVPGLPLSFLNHGLVHGNSLTGVGTVQEIRDALAEANTRELKSRALTMSAMETALEEFAERVESHIRALSELPDASINDVASATRLQAEMKAALSPLTALCDLITAERATRHLGDVSEEFLQYDKYGKNPKTKRRKSPHPDRVLLTANAAMITASTAEALEAAVMTHPHLTRARAIAREVRAVHVPVVFPEVFRGAHQGLHCILGNPPWDKVRHEATQFWVTIQPGLNNLPDARRKAEIERLRLERPNDALREEEERLDREQQKELFKVGFKLGGSHVELAQLVLERAINLIRPDGRLGLVLPRQFTVLAGWKDLREVLTQHFTSSVVQGRNHGQWIFDGIHNSYAVVLLSAAPETGGVTRVAVARSEAEIAQVGDNWLPLTASEVGTLSDSHALPWLNNVEDRDLFDRMRTFSRLASGAAWVQARYDSRWDFTGQGRDAHLAASSRSPRSWAVMMTRHVLPFGVKSEGYKQFIEDLDALVSCDKGVEYGDDLQATASGHPAILIRRPSRSDDARTLIATAMPARGYLPNAGSVHAVRTAESTESTRVLALLGYINTYVADWWARRFVDRHVTAPVVNQLALPDWSPEQIAEAASLTGSLLARNGYEECAGTIAVADAHAGQSDQELVVALNTLALKGFGLNATDFSLMAEDFSDNGMSPIIKNAILSSLSETE